MSDEIVSNVLFSELHELRNLKKNFEEKILKKEKYYISLYCKGTYKLVKDIESVNYRFEEIITEEKVINILKEEIKYLKHTIENFKKTQKQEIEEKEKYKTLYEEITKIKKKKYLIF